MITKPEIQKILYCTDLGKHTIPVFMQALAQADKNDARVTILHIVEPMTDAAKAVLESYLSETEVETIQKDGMDKVFKYMKKRVDTFLKEQCGKSLELEPIDAITVIAGKPSEEILRIAEEQDFDMIVVGKSSKKIMGSNVIGSVARLVTRFSKVPVLVVPNR